MSCVRPRRFFTIVATLGSAATTSCTALHLGPRGVAAAFRPPSIVLAYPADGAALPADKALVVFRFSPGQDDDPIDPSAFRATVDGADYTARFRVTAGEAWGQLGDSSATPSLTPGSHLIAARACSARGACGLVSARVEVRPWECLVAPPRERGARAQQAPNDESRRLSSHRGI